MLILKVSTWCACDTHTGSMLMKFGMLLLDPYYCTWAFPLPPRLKIDDSDPHFLPGLTNHHRLIWFSTSSLAGGPVPFITWKQVRQRGTAKREGTKRKKKRTGQKFSITRQPIKEGEGLIQRGRDSEVIGSSRARVDYHSDETNMWNPLLTATCVSWIYALQLNTCQVYSCPTSAVIYSTQTMFYKRFLGSGRSWGVPVGTKQHE